MLPEMIKREYFAAFIFNSDGGKNPTAIVKREPKIPIKQVIHIPMSPPGILNEVALFL